MLHASFFNFWVARASFFYSGEPRTPPRGAADSSRTPDFGGLLDAPRGPKWARMLPPRHPRCHPKCFLIFSILGHGMMSILSPTWTVRILQNCALATVPCSFLTFGLFACWTKFRLQLGHDMVPNWIKTGLRFENDLEKNTLQHSLFVGCISF